MKKYFHKKIAHIEKNRFGNKKKSIIVGLDKNFKNLIFVKKIRNEKFLRKLSFQVWSKI